MQRIWDSFDNYDDSFVDELTTRSAKTMAATKAAAMRSAVGFYSILAGVRPPVIRPDELDLVPDMREPFISTWQALASGRTLTDAIAAGKSRVEAVVIGYAVSSARQTGDIFVAKTNIENAGWERVPDGNACDWCLSLTDITYASAAAADFGHDRCGCTPVPSF